MSIAMMSRDLDIHNAAVDERLADHGYCGVIHLPTGRVCTLAGRHLGGCEFNSRLGCDQPNQTCSLTCRAGLRGHPLDRLPAHRRRDQSHYQPPTPGGHA